MSENSARITNSCSTTGGRQGQTTRFEYLLLAGMGEAFIQRHFFVNNPWFLARDYLQRLVESDIEVRSYDPLDDTPETRPDTAQLS